MSVSREIYLDHAATTPLDPDVASAMASCAGGDPTYGNPSANHAAGRRARSAIEKARGQCAALINAEPREIVFTSGATEADNLAVIGGARFRAHRGRHIVTMASEHKAVLGAADTLEREGFLVTRLAPGSDGTLDPAKLEAALSADTQLVSIMAINNETGVRQDVAAIGRLCRERDILFHTDAAQAAGKEPLDVKAMPIDLLSMTAHKMYGPQGVGALYVSARHGVGVTPLFFGGAQERRVRPGTLPVAPIVGFGVAAELARLRLDQTKTHLSLLRERLWSGIADLPGVTRNGDPDRSFPGILNISTAEIEGESLMLALEPLVVGSGAACNAQSGEASAVLRSMGLSDLAAQGAVRFSFGRGTTMADVECAVSAYRAAVTHLRRLSVPRAGSG
ncbi:MAG: aminotransferase class V-fold PLP-dependent enzyme [Pseudomonadota bacterium]